MDHTNIAIIGAGPHGIAAAAHLRRASVECHVIGSPMSFWQTMPEGMLLRSNRTATSIAEYDGPLSLESYYTERRAAARTAGSARRLRELRPVGAAAGRAGQSIKRVVSSVHAQADGFVLTMSGR